MEKIEFRVWDNYDKEMYYNVAVGCDLRDLNYYGLLGVAISIIRDIDKGELNE